MPRIEDLLFSVRRISSSANGTLTKRQIEAVEHLALGTPPADMTFAEASALLTARNTARDVLQQLNSKARIHGVKRLQLEPYLIWFITSDAHIMRELMQRNKNRWGFCKDDVPPPTPETQTKVFGEARSLIAGMPHAKDTVISPSRRNYASVWKKITAIPKARNKRTRRYYRRNKRGNTFWWGMRRSLTAIVWPIEILFSLIAATKSRKYVRLPDMAIVGDRNFKLATNDDFSSSGNLKGRASVIDGDTIEIHGQRIRLWGIDAVEDGQLCIKNGKPWRCGHDCAKALATFLGTQTVTCVSWGRDDFNRIVATCEVGGRDVGAWLVRNGWALHYKRYSKGRYAEAQADAKKAGRGLWQGEFELPWKWRVRSRWLSENHSSPF